MPDRGQTAGVIFASVIIAAALSPVRAQQMDCGLEPGLKAIAGQAAAVLSFHNPSAQPRRLYWIDFQGHRKSYGTIAPSGDRKQSSSVGNHWVATDEADQCVALFAASAAANAFVIAPLPASVPASVAAGTTTGPTITLEGFNKLFPPGGATGMPTSTMVSTPEGPVMVMAFVPPPAAAGDPAQPAITLDALNALLFPPGDGCGVPMRVGVQSAVGPRLVSAVRPPRPGRCGFAAAPSPAQGAPPGDTGATNK